MEDIKTTKNVLVIGANIVDITRIAITYLSSRYKILVADISRSGRYFRSIFGNLYESARNPVEFRDVYYCIGQTYTKCHWMEYDICFMYYDDYEDISPAVPSIDAIYVGVGMVTGALCQLNNIKDVETQHIYLIFRGKEEDVKKYNLVEDVKMYIARQDGTYFIPADESDMQCYLQLQYGKGELEHLSKPLSILLNQMRQMAKFQ